MTERGTIGARRHRITAVLRVHRTLELNGCGPRNDILLGWTRDHHSGIRPSTLRVMIHRSMATGWDEVIPSFDGTDFRQYERRLRLFVSHTRVAPERRAGKLLERLEGGAFDLCVEIQDLRTPKGVENVLDHLRRHFEPIDVFRQGTVVDDFVGDFERPPGEEVEEYAPRRNAISR